MRAAVTLRLSADEADVVRIALARYVNECDPKRRAIRGDDVAEREIADARRAAFRSMNRLDRLRSVGA